MRRSALLVLASVGSSNASVGSSTTPPPCDYGTGVMKWEAEPRHVFVVPCSQDPTQRWSGAALTAGAKVPSSVLSNAGAPADTRCLGSKERDPIGMVPCADAPHFIYNHSNKSLAIADGTGRCVDVNHGSGPDIEFYSCHTAENPDLTHQQFDYDSSTHQLSSVANTSLCLAVNRSVVVPYVTPPCVWPSVPAAGLPFAVSESMVGITVLENATAIQNYGADTWYPAEDRNGDLFSGFDDGKVQNVSVGSACTRPRAKCASGKYGFQTGSAVVSGSDWRTLTVDAPGGSIFEDGYPMQGRYTCANAVANGTWWIGTYGLAVGDASCEAGTGVLQL